MTPLKLTISKAISKFSAQEFHAYVKSLYKATESTTQSKILPRINLNFTKSGKCIIKITGEKQILESELELLSTEYTKSKEELLELFKKRKILVISDETKEPLGGKSERSEKAKRIPKPRRAKRKKEDAPALEGRDGEVPL